MSRFDALAASVDSSLFATFGDSARVFRGALAPIPCSVVKGKALGSTDVPYTQVTLTLRNAEVQGLPGDIVVIHPAPYTAWRLDALIAETAATQRWVVLQAAVPVGA